MKYNIYVKAKDIMRICQYVPYKLLQQWKLEVSKVTGKTKPMEELSLPRGPQKHYKSFES